jgi:hypothetical protein
MLPFFVPSDESPVVDGFHYIGRRVGSGTASIRRLRRRMPDYLEFDPSIIEKGQVYRLLTGAVVPRPIG